MDAAGIVPESTVAAQSASTAPPAAPGSGRVGSKDARDFSAKPLTRGPNNARCLAVCFRGGLMRRSTTVRLLFSKGC